MARLDKTSPGIPFLPITTLPAAPTGPTIAPLAPSRNPVTQGNNPLNNTVDLGPATGAQSHNIDPVQSGGVFKSNPPQQLQPPDKNAPPTREGAQQLRAWLAANQANGSEAKTTWQFYEQIDQYLGPFGDEGYPLAYGKQYNKAFMENETLMADPTTRGWVENTGTALQKSVSDYIMQRYEAGTLGEMTEPELREYAFDSHPEAYFQSGLTDVVLNSPELLDDIVAVPIKEFIPGSGNVMPSLKQAVVTGGMVAGEMIDRAADTVVETVGEGVDYVANSTVGQAVGQGYNQVADTVSEGYNQVADTVSEGYNQAAKTATTGYNYVANSTVGRTVSQGYNRAANTVSEGYNQAAKTATAGYNYVANSTAGRTVSQGYNQAAKTATAGYNYVANSTAGRTVSQGYNQAANTIKSGWNSLFGN